MAVLKVLLQSRFDVIVVGAGPAGSSAAYTLAKKGFKVLLVERGRIVGSKNLFGGRVYVKPLEEIFPNLRKNAPIQRWVTKERISIVNKNDVLSLDFDGKDSTSFICYLSQLASWMARQAEEAGAVLLTEITVNNFHIKDEKVKGIVSGSDVIESEVVIDAEGINRILLERAGFVKELKPDYVSLGVKETIKLPNSEIEKRFGLEDKEGLAWILMGDITKKIPGGAFIYTNDGAVSMGIVLLLGHAVKMIDKPVYEIVEDIRLHQTLGKYFSGGNIIEYSAHLIPEAGTKLIPSKLYHDGLLIVGDAAGLLLNLGYSYRGVDFASYSGYLAAKAVEKAFEDGKYDSSRLALYEQLIKQSFVMKQLIKFKKVHDLINDVNIFQRYPSMANEIARKLFLIDYNTPTLIEAVKEAKDGVNWISLLLSMYRLVSSI
jgi:electron transfer flavoprotein-quinone oxidoreductase